MQNKNNSDIEKNHTKVPKKISDVNVLCTI